MLSTRMRFMIIVLATTFVACGSEEGAPLSESIGAEGELPEVSAPGGVVRDLLPETAEAVTNCLDLVRRQNYQQAIPTCTEALRTDPDNFDVQTALESAQQKVASQMTELGEEALEKEAEEEATKKLQESIPGMR